MFVSFDITSKEIDSNNYFLYYDDNNQKNNKEQLIHFHIEFLKKYEKKRKIQIIFPNNKKKMIYNLN